MELNKLKDYGMVITQIYLSTKISGIKTRVKEYYKVYKIHKHTLTGLIIMTV